jgi:primosomal protein N' (replication factor Y)
VRYVSVAVPVPFLDRLTYNVPDHLELPVVGARVRVPVGSRTLTGCVVQQSADASDPESVKDIVEVLDREPFLPPGVM